MKSMKVTVITLLLGATLLSANANKFTEKREIAINHLTKKIELLNTFKSCLNLSKDTRAMKSCRQDFKASRLLLRTDTKAKREALKAK
jgi:hypothetical protein